MGESRRYGDCHRIRLELTHELVGLYDTGRLQQDIGKAIPIRLLDHTDPGTVVASPVLGGLHHDDRSAAYPNN